MFSVVIEAKRWFLDIVTAIVGIVDNKEDTFVLLLYRLDRTARWLGKFNFRKFGIPRGLPRG